jgi:hypothetical protein
MVATYVVHQYAGEITTNQTSRILYDEPPKDTMTTGAVLRLQTTKFDLAVAKMMNAIWRRRTRIIQCQEIDDRNNIMLPHPKQGGLEGGRLGMRRNE